MFFNSGRAPPPYLGNAQKNFFFSFGGGPNALPTVMFESWPDYCSLYYSSALFGHVLMNSLSLSIDLVVACIIVQLDLLVSDSVPIRVVLRPILNTIYITKIMICINESTPDRRAASEWWQRCQGDLLGLWSFLRQGGNLSLCLPPDWDDVEITSSSR